eukprot:1383799-Amphidinium_carterae.1
MDNQCALLCVDTWCPRAYEMFRDCLAEASRNHEQWSDMTPAAQAGVERTYILEHARYRVSNYAL